jgi:hypothetical protein
MDVVLVYAASIVIIVWGIAHIIPTRNVVAGFGALSADNRQIITMEWVAEGLALTFIGLLALSVTWSEGIESSGAAFVYRACAIMLVVMAGWTAMTGAKTSILPIKLCPFVKTGAALLLLVGSMV